MRSVFVHLHRWLGLTIAGFLFISGITGAIISWDHELDELLNPHLTEVQSRGQAIPSLEIAKRIEAANPHAWVTFIPLLTQHGESATFGISPRINPDTGRAYELGYNQVFVDPITGLELGKREWGAVSLSRENLISFLYKLHYSLHIPEMWGIDSWGIWLLGIIAMIWVLDCFFGFYLTLPLRRRQRLSDNNALHNEAIPNAYLQPKLSTQRTEPTWWERWLPAWQVRWKNGIYKRNFDLHRATSLWTWAVLFIMAFTAFSLNLNREVFFPVMSLVSNVTPTPFDLRVPRDKHNPIIPKVNYESIIDKAHAESARRGWKEPAGSIFYAEDYGIYGVAFFHPGDDHGAAGVGPANLYFDAQDGRYLGDRKPWQGSVADIFIQMQFPLHSGRILGLPGRILISIMGLVVAMLSVTGVYIWWKKRHSRAVLTERTRQTPNTAVT
ncbi:MAG: PepSY-associated TM helix domain-containing protein [Candidatus Nitrotoga sp.]|nr:PepSY-associated TM helix domain-containing protein [Candidatus Nitrotoga sp.]MDO9447874.1 PepSY-associated TM helix domain-containing protein [Candidatus Nitrotoga sp.]MDP3496548.1 PepSY-associated TM helix domain-containing protein [Candidatus Nitrotoga sp.]